MFSGLLLNSVFVLAVTLIWFMMLYQSLLFYLGHRYCVKERRRKAAMPVPDQDLPGVTVLVPCHNEGRVIAHTVRALLGLDYPAGSIEFLLINDGSTDDTADSIRAATSDPRVRVLDVPVELAARGKSGALNYGLRFARNPILAIYDADNTPEPGALRPLVEELVRDSQLGAAIGMYRMINSRRNLFTRFLNIEGISFQWIVQAGRWMLLRFVSLPGTNFVIRRDLVEKLNGWDVSALTEDAELTLRIYQEGYFIKFVPNSVSWEQEPETLPVWFRQRNRWVRGSNYLIRRHALRLLHAKPRLVAWEMLYSLCLYYVFFFAVVISDLLFLGSLAGMIRITVPGPYTLVWLFAFLTFVMQIVVALAGEGEDSALNILLAMAMYFTYCQLWIPLVAKAFYDDFVARRPMKWAKTERFEVQ